MDIYVSDVENCKVTFVFPKTGVVNVGEFFEKLDGINANKGDKGSVTVVYPDDWSSITISGVVYFDQFQSVLKNLIFGDIDKKLADPNFDGNTLPTIYDFAVIVRDISSGKPNLYGTGIDKIAKLYYDKGASSKYSRFIGDSFVFDGKPELTKMGKDSMYDKTSDLFTGAYNLDIGFVLSSGATVKNVNIVDENNRGRSYGRTSLNKLVNVRFETDVDYITGATSAYGVVEFAGLPPQNTPVMEGRVIINKTNPAQKVAINDTNDVVFGAGVDYNQLLGSNGSPVSMMHVTELFDYKGEIPDSYAPSTQARFKFSGGSWVNTYTDLGYTPLKATNQYWEEQGNAQPLS